MGGRKSIKNCFDCYLGEILSENLSKVDLSSFGPFNTAVRGANVTGESLGGYNLINVTKTLFARI